LVPTFDYYFTKNNFRPYIDLGVGYYSLADYAEVSQRDIATSSEDRLEVSINNQVGFLLRIGLDLGKLRAG